MPLHFSIDTMKRKILMHTFELRSARVSAIPKVPFANASNSNTPMGPFQMMVLASAKASWNAFRESGPMSRP